jgi:hypothetical protein
MDKPVAGTVIKQDLYLFEYEKKYSYLTKFDVVEQSRLGSSTFQKEAKRKRDFL